MNHGLSYGGSLGPALPSQADRLDMQFDATALGRTIEACGGVSSRPPLSTTLLLRVRWRVSQDSQHDMSRRNTGIAATLTGLFPSSSLASSNVSGPRTTRSGSTTDCETTALHRLDRQTGNANPCFTLGTASTAYTTSSG